MLTKLKGSKYCYVSATIQLKIRHFLLLNDQIFLIQAIQFSISQQI